MIDNWIVFGGWAIPPQILTPLFGPGAVLIDTNEIMPDLVRNNTLAPDWQSIFADRILQQIPPGPYGIAGWSTGSLLAYALAHKTKPAYGVFISATPSFCRRHGFTYGWKPSALKAMRGELAANPEKVLAEVYIQCGIETSSPFSPSPEEKRGKSYINNLIAGLFFLEQATLLPVQRLAFPALFLHGKADAIIPHAAGKYFCDAAGGTFIDYEGPHAFFINQFEAIAKSINQFTEEIPGK
jgi:pimeloyl-ACP methyl ester carboxylesterase